MVIKSSNFLILVFSSQNLRSLSLTIVMEEGLRHPAYWKIEKQLSDAEY